MVAFAIFGPRHVALFLGERVSASAIRDGRGLLLQLQLLLWFLLLLSSMLARIKDRLSSSELLDYIRGDEMRKEEATSARR